MVYKNLVHQTGITIMVFLFESPILTETSVDLFFSEADIIQIEIVCEIGSMVLYQSKRFQSWPKAYLDYFPPLQGESI